MSDLALAQGPVVVTGICRRLGKRVARVLHRECKVIGVDRRPFPDKSKDIEHQRLDIRRKKLKDAFRHGDARAVVHLGVMHDPRASSAEHHSWNVAGFAKLLEYVAQFKVPKLVVLSSSNVYGPQPGNAQFQPETETVVLRPVHILGTVRNAPSNFLRVQTIPTLLGYDR